MQKSQKVDCLFVLEKMEEKLTAGWHQYGAAKDKDGNPVYPDSPDAVSFDLTGAYHAVVSKYRPLVSVQVEEEVKHAFVRAMNKKRPTAVSRATIWHYLYQYNDAPDRVKWEIMELMKLAKESCDA